METLIFWGVIVITFFLAGVICSNLFEGEIDFVPFMWGIFVTWFVMFGLGTLIWFVMDAIYASSI